MLLNLKPYAMFFEWTTGLAETTHSPLAHTQIHLYTPYVRRVHTYGSSQFTLDYGLRNGTQSRFNQRTNAIKSYSDEHTKTTGPTTHTLGQRAECREEEKMRRNVTFTFTNRRENFCINGAGNSVTAVISNDSANMCAIVCDCVRLYAL